MSTDTQIQASMWLMILVQTIGAIDIPKGPRLLPAPRVYVAIVVVWSALGLLVSAGAGRAAAAMGWVTVLAAMVIGPFGSVLNGFLNTIATRFGKQPINAPLPPGVTVQ